MTVSFRRSLLAAVSAIALAISFAPALHAQEAALSADAELAAKGVWSATATYAKDDIVTARGSAWISRRAGNKNKVPGQTGAQTTAIWWQLFARGFNATGAWVNTTKYQPDDLVTFSGQTFRAKVTQSNRQPAANQFWELLAAKGAAGPNTGIGLGTASVPSISFNGDPGTGIFSPGAGKIALVANGELFLHNKGTVNTALGVSALASNTTGESNTAVGHAALASNTSGQANTAVGQVALRSNTTGMENTAVGYRALRDNTAGGSNTALGSFVLASNTTGESNTAVGRAALVANTTGSNNTALGVSALSSNSVGDSNTALGREALLANTLGTDNTAVGRAALGDNTSGEANTAVGVAALNVNTTGDGNTAVGRLALFTNTTGTNNTGLGTGALASNQTGNNNVAIGSEAGVNATNNPSNSIFIGNTGATSDTNTIKIGTQNTQTTAFMAGISGVTVANSVAVLINQTTGQLGTIPSSRRYKDDIAPMPDMSAMLAKLRPVTFRYKKPYAEGDKPLEYGLIAEEVADVFPALAVFNKEGAPETVKYHLLPSFLLAGYQAQQKTIDAQSEKIDAQAGEISDLKQRLANIEAMLPKITKAALQ